MSTNRVLLHLGQCRCQRLAKAKALCSEIAHELDPLVANEIEFNWTGGELEFFLAADIKPAPEPLTVDGTADHLSRELRRIADELLAAAGRLEGGAA